MAGLPFSSTEPPFSAARRDQCMLLPLKSFGPAAPPSYIAIYKTHTKNTRKNHSTRTSRLRRYSHYLPTIHGEREIRKRARRRENTGIPCEKDLGIVNRLDYNNRVRNRIEYPGDEARTEGRSTRTLVSRVGAGVLQTTGWVRKRLFDKFCGERTKIWMWNYHFRKACKDELGNRSRGSVAGARSCNM